MDEQTERWKQHIKDELVPMLEDSKVVLSIVPPDDKLDAKFAVELGLSIMMDKPLLIVVTPGSKVPNKLVLVADSIIEADITTDKGHEALARAIKKHMESNP